MEVLSANCQKEKTALGVGKGRLPLCRIWQIGFYICSPTDYNLIYLLRPHPLSCLGCTQWLC